MEWLKTNDVIIWMLNDDKNWRGNEFMKFWCEQAANKQSEAAKISRQQIIQSKLRSPDRHATAVCCRARAGQLTQSKCKGPAHAIEFKGVGAGSVLTSKGLVQSVFRMTLLSYDSYYTIYNIYHINSIVSSWISVNMLNQAQRIKETTTTLTCYGMFLNLTVYHPMRSWNGQHMSLQCFIAECLLYPKMAPTLGTWATCRLSEFFSGCLYLSSCT